MTLVVVLVALIVGAVIGVRKGEGIGGIVLEALASGAIAGVALFVAGTLNNSGPDGSE